MRQAVFPLMLGVALVLLFAGGATGGEYEAEDYAPLLKELPQAKHGLTDVISEVSKGPETAIKSKFEMEDGKLLVGVYPAEKGLGVDAENNVFKEYNGAASEAKWTPEEEVFKDFEHIARSAQYETLLSMTKLSLLDIIAKAQKDQPGTVFEVKPIVEDGRPIFSVMVAEDGNFHRLRYDLVSGTRL
jgi:uncharacterized membrane protein YkoI